MIDSPHIPVLLREAVDALAIKPSGIYFDGTFGRGGHTAEILQRLDSTGRLLAMDKDPEAIQVARTRFATERRLTVARGSFALATQVADEQRLTGRIDGLLLDLGLSSPQLDDPARGFSFSHDGPLDMRMDPDAGMPAAAWLADATQEEISEVIKSYGDERHARRIARAIDNARLDAPIETTARLADIVSSVVPRVRSKRGERSKHPATRTFQAIRIFLNRELDDLRALLEQAPALVREGGRLVVISFHSLEDRIVKHAIKPKVEVLPRGLPVMGSPAVTGDWRALGKPVSPSPEECGRNPRARSAVLRVAERCV